MFTTLKSKFITSFIILELIFFTVIVNINFNSLDNASHTLTNEKINVTGQLLVELLKTPLIVSDIATIDDIVLNFSSIKNTVAIQIEDNNNHILSNYLKEGTLPLELFQKTALEANDTSIIHKGQEYRFNSTKVMVENKYIAKIHFVFNTNDSFEHIQKNRNLTYLMILIALIISFIVSYIIGNNLGKSLSFLTKIAQNIAHDKKVTISNNSTKSKDEVGKLFHSMEIMQQLIYERTEKLNKSLTLFSENVIASSTDIDGNITFVSQALCEISGYSIEELIGKPHNILRHQDMASKFFENLWKTLKSREIWEGEIKNRTKDGGHYWVKTTIIPEFDADETIIGYTSIKHDITAQKAKDEFLANMSHELRTPLNSIIGFSNILNKKLQNSQHLSLLKHISSSSKSLLILINDILDLSKIQDSKFTIEPYEFNAYNEILEYSKNFEGLTSQNNINVNITIDKNLNVVLFGDWHRISQIILNIISNAIKFTPKDGLIIYNAAYINGNLILSISDNGIGMSKEVQDKIFKPFEQADGSTTRKYGGTGLGLSITQSLVELMDGKIELESELNKGTIFTITLPLKEVQNSKLQNNNINLSMEDDENLLSGHILVAEDNKTNQMLIKMLLEDFGLTCDIADDGLQAVEIYDPNLHKLILMDENMPNLNGLKAMQLIRKKYQEKCGAIIAITANTMAGDENKFLNLGMDGYIAKPIDENTLYKTLKEFL